jgi:hypothetical protein
LFSRKFPELAKTPTVNPPKPFILLIYEVKRRFYLELLVTPAASCRRTRMHIIIIGSMKRQSTKQDSRSAQHGEEYDNVRRVCMAVSILS